MEHKQEEINKFIELAHNYHLTIKFMTEIADTQITFLDTCVYTRKGDTCRFKKESILDMRIHFKLTETLQYSHFTSCHSPSVRKGFIEGEVLRTNSDFKTYICGKHYTIQMQIT